jgi:DNA polymerase-3 subunit delta'
MIVHEQKWQVLKKTAALGKIPHALLFYGQAAIGKKKTALEFIKLLNCENPDLEKRPCSACRSCRDIEKNSHPDLYIIEPGETQEIKIGQIRELQANLSLKSYSAPFKAAIINKAHFLNQEAQSAFLKLLEEPRGQTIFILVSEYPEMLLPTILSRVERLRFYAPAQTQRSPEQQELVAQIIKLGKEDLFSRFQYAKKLSEGESDLKEILDVWLGHFREMLLTAANGKTGAYSVEKLTSIIKTIQNVGFLISTTNVNSRLALETLMLEL